MLCGQMSGAGDVPIAAAPAKALYARSMSVYLDFRLSSWPQPRVVFCVPSCPEFIPVAIGMVNRGRPPVPADRWALIPLQR